MKIMTDVLYVVLFLLVCAAPVLLAVLILKVLERKAPWWNTETKEKFKNYFLGVSTIVVVPMVLLIVIDPYVSTLFPESAWAYAMQYNTESQYVVMDSKPHDCEFFKAPIGNKYCHFDRTVTTQKGDEGVNHRVLVYVNWNKVSE
jgi:hypothetical protein